MLCYLAAFSKILKRIKFVIIKQGSKIVFVNAFVVASTDNVCLYVVNEVYFITYLVSVPMKSLHGRHRKCRPKPTSYIEIVPVLAYKCSFRFFKNSLLPCGVSELWRWWVTRMKIVFKWVVNVSQSWLLVALFRHTFLKILLEWSHHDDTTSVATFQL